MNDIEHRIREAGRAIDAAVADIAMPTAPLGSASEPWRRYVVAAAAAFVLLIVIGGSTIWVRSSESPDVAEPDLTPTTDLATTAITLPASGEVAGLEARLRAASLDLRTLRTAPEFDVAALETRLETVEELAASAGDEAARTQAAQLGVELTVLREMRATIDERLARLGAIVGEAEMRLEALGRGAAVELSEVSALLDAAGDDITAVRSLRTDLSAAGEALSALIARVYVQVAPPPPPDEIVAVDHDLGLADLGVVGTGLSALAVEPSGTTVWATTGLILDASRGEVGEALSIDATTGEVREVIELPQPMRLIDPVDGMVWIARWGDGALPDSLIGTIDPTTGRVETWDLGDFSVSGVAGDATGAWMVQGGGRPPELARFDLAAGAITARYSIDVAGPLTDIVISGEETPVIWVSDWAGTVVRLDPASGAEIGRTDLQETGTNDLQVSWASDDKRQYAAWALTESGSVHRIGSDGGVLASFSLDETLCCMTGDPGSETTFFIASSATLYAGHPASPPTPSTVLDPVVDLNGDLFSPGAIVQTGNSIWIARGSWLTEVRLPQ